MRADYDEKSDCAIRTPELCGIAYIMGYSPVIFIYKNNMLCYTQNSTYIREDNYGTV